MIRCDICNIVVVSPKDSEALLQNDFKEHTILRVRSHKFCLCFNCENAVLEFLSSEECKEMCLKYKKQIEEEMS